MAEESTLHTAAHDAIARAVKVNSVPDSEALRLVRQDRNLAEAIVRECDLLSLPDDRLWGPLTVALLRAGVARSSIAAYLEDALQRSANLRSTLMRTGRTKLYADIVRNLIAKDRVRALTLSTIREFATQLFETGRPALALQTLEAGGQIGRKEVAMIESRCRFILGDRAAARSLLAPGAPPSAQGFDQAYLAAWMDHHTGITPVADAEVRVLHSALLLRLWPNLQLPALALAETAPTSAAASWLAMMGTAASTEFTVIGPGPDEIASASTSLGLPFLPLTVMTAPFAELMAQSGEAGPPARLAPFDREALFDCYAGHPIEGLMRQKLPNRWLTQAVLGGRGVSIACPWTGGMLNSRHIVVIDLGRTLYAVIFLSQSPDCCFLLLSCGWNLFRKDLLVFPQLQTAVRLHDWRDVTDLREASSITCQTLAKLKTEVAGFLTSPTRPGIVTAMQSNMGHHYHNELAGLQQVSEAGQLGSALPITIGPHDYYDLAEVFSLPTETPLCRVESPNEATLLGLQNNWSLINPRTIAAPIGLARRITAPIAPPPERRAVLIMLRSNRRVWVSQVPTVIEIVLALWREYGVAEFLLDGVTRAGAADHRLNEWISREEKIVDEIRTTLLETEPSLKIVSLVGSTMAQKLKAHSRVLFSICPKGNGLVPNLSWIANRPAIVHGNAHDVVGATWEAKFRPDGYLPVIIDRDYIIDEAGIVLDEGVGRLSTAQWLAMGYDLAQDGILEAVRELATELLGLKGGAAPEQF
jgi:hypothetical protein